MGAINHLFNPFDPIWDTSKEGKYSKKIRSETAELKKQRDNANQRRRYHELKKLNSK